MWIKDYVMVARTGDEKAFNWLVEHFEPLFCDSVVRFNSNDETLRNEAKKKLPNIIRKYIDNNYDSKLDNYLRARAHIEFRDKNKLNDTRVLGIEELINIYSKRFLKVILKYNDILTEEELNNYSIKYVTNLINMYIEDRESFSNNVNSRMAFESKYVQNKDIFLIRYVVQEGSNDRIINYFYNKYFFLVEEYKTRSSYMLLKNSFKEIVEDVLNNITSYVSNIETHLRKGISKKQAEIRNYLKEEEKKVRVNESSKVLIYNSYYSVIEFIYQKYKDKIDMPEDEIKKILQEKYDLYFNGYINGSASSDLRKHLVNSFNNYFNWVINNTIKKKIRFVDSDTVKTKDGEDNANKRINKKS